MRMPVGAPPSILRLTRAFWTCTGTPPYLEASTPPGYRKSFTYDKSDEERDIFDSALRSKRSSRSYLSDSDSESKPAESTA
ncbi:UNVERIFIED_CONTAM: hypothetical protein K2H54_030779 [Gekko kuhli]